MSRRLDRWCDWCSDDIARRADVGACYVDRITGEVRLYCKRCMAQEHLQAILEADGFIEAGADELAEIERLMEGGT